LQKKQGVFLPVSEVKECRDIHHHPTTTTTAAAAAAALGLGVGVGLLHRHW